MSPAMLVKIYKASASLNSKYIFSTKCVQLHRNPSIVKITRSDPKEMDDEISP